jgi:hypothetical protein
MWMKEFMEAAAALADIDNNPYYASTMCANG